jgi:hypothetical protein
MKGTKENPFSFGPNRTNENPLGSHPRGLNT